MDKFDKLWNLYYEEQQFRTVEFSEYQELFPALSEDIKTHVYEDFMRDIVISDYAYNLSIGLDQDEAARAAGISPVMIVNIYTGKGVSVATLARVAKAIATEDGLTKAGQLKGFAESNNYESFLKVTHKLPRRSSYNDDEDDVFRIEIVE
jgi:hypothetical protein